MYPLLDKNGDAEFLVGYGMDITARKKSKLELQRMAIVAEKTNGIVMITDPKSGDKIWFYLNIAAVYDDVGKLINYVLIAFFHDLINRPWN